MSNNEPHLELVASPGQAVRASDAFADGASMSVGSLPHRDADAAAAFALSEFKIATIPSLPQRSVCEAMVAQALVGIDGVSIGLDGSITVDASRVEQVTSVPITTDVDHEAYGGLRAFVSLARKVSFDGRPWKWQHIGPVTLGLELVRAGIDDEVAFEVALAVVRSRVSTIVEYLEQMLPSSIGAVVLDEPSLPSPGDPDFVLAPDEIADLLAGALVAIGPAHITGVHSCGGVDLGLLSAVGATLLSFPAVPALVNAAGYIDRHLADGGMIAWGVIPTDGPVAGTSQRSWRELSELWCELVQRGCDAKALRRQSLVTPHCGLAGHSVSVARRIARLSHEIGERVASQAMATRFVLGA